MRGFSRRSWQRGALVVVLTGGLLATTPMPPAGANHRQRQQVLQREIAAKRQAIRQAEAQERDLVRLIQRSDARRAVLSHRLATLQAKLAEARYELLVLEDRLDLLQAELRAKTRALERTRAELEDKVTQLNGRVADMYIDAPSGYTMAVEVTEDFSALLVASEYTSAIVRADMKLVADIEHTKGIIEAQRAAIADRAALIMEDRKAALEAARRIATVRNAHAAARAAVQREIDYKRRLLEQVRDEKEAYKRALRNLEAQSRSIAAFLRGHQAGQRVIKGVGGYLRWPISGRISSGYGWRKHPIYRYRSFHTGIDISSPSGTPVGAARAGKVLDTGYYGAYGLVVIIDHGNSLATVYAHLRRVYVKPGDKVGLRQTIAAVGATGWATGPHLHFEVRVAGDPQNPLGWL